VVRAENGLALRARLRDELSSSVSTNVVKTANRPLVVGQNHFGVAHCDWDHVSWIAQVDRLVQGMQQRAVRARRVDGVLDNGSRNETM
jgi:hypothetical protein